MDVTIRPCSSMPCSLDVFEINGITACEDDFGEVSDHEPEDADEHGCGFYRFEANREPKQETLGKYHITREEYLSVCDQLEEELSVGECDWCQ